MRVACKRGTATFVVVPLLLAVVSCSGSGLAINTSRAVRSVSPLSSPSPARISAAAGRSSTSAVAAPTGALRGKFQVLSIEFPTPATGYVAMGGFPSDRDRLYDWFERGADHGRSWMPLSLGKGDAAPASAAHVAWIDARQAWASVVSYATHAPVSTLYFTTDAARTWHVEREPFWIADIAVSHGSSWLVATSLACHKAVCPDTIYTADRVGGPLTRLPVQPSIAEGISDLVRVSTDTAAAVLRSHDSFRLRTTADAGRSWQNRPLPCGPRPIDVRAMASPDGTLYLTCTGASGSTCESCGPVTIFRSTDLGTSWTRSAAQGTGGGLCCVASLTPASAREVWLLQTMPDGSGALLRSVDDGDTFARVLDVSKTGYLGPLAAHDDTVWVVADRTTRNGSVFSVYRSTDDGKTWQISRLPTPRGMPSR